MHKIKITESNHEQYYLEIQEEKDLKTILFQLLKKEIRIIVMEMSNIGILTLGIGMPYGFIQFSEDGTPPYLVALNHEPIPLSDIGDEIEFDAGGTPTSIPVTQCLPYEQIVEIVVFIIKNKELPCFIEWQEI